MRHNTAVILMYGAILMLVIGFGQAIAFGDVEPYGDLPRGMGDGSGHDWGLEEDREFVDGDDDDDIDDDEEFAGAIAGTYVTTEGAFGGGLMFHADGTLVAVSNACCGAGLTGNQQSEAIGNWVRTGDYQIELSAVIAASYFDSEHVPLPAGEVNGVCIASEQINFDSDYLSYTGLLVTKCWLESADLAAMFGGTGGPLPDLLDPDARPPDLCTADLLGGPIPIAGGRLPVEFPTCGMP